METNANKVNKLHSVWLTVKLSYRCFICSIQAIILSYLKKNDRKAHDKLIHHFAKSILKPLKINFSLNNWERLNNLPNNQPIIIMSNHSSLYDIPIIMHTLPKDISLRMLAKKELYKIPFFGRGMTSLNFPKIDRSNHKQALLDLEFTKELMRSGIVIWAAPEGRRSPTSELLPFKKGIFIMAIELGALIVPISIKNANKVLPPNSYNYSINEHVILTVGNFIDTSKLNIEDRDEIIAQVRTQIANSI